MSSQQAQTRAVDAGTTTGLLAHKHAVIFGAGGAIGAALANEFAAQGATLSLSGRHTDSLSDLAEVDAENEPQVIDYLDKIADARGNIDIVVNVTGPRPQTYSNGTPALQLPLEQFMVPLNTLVRSQFVTARAAAQHMVRQASGVILFVTALPARGRPNVSAIGSAFGAMESLARCLAVELGPSGVRVLGIRSAAMVDTPTIRWGFLATARVLSVSEQEVITNAAQATLLKRLPLAADTARLAAFLVSDAARTVTGTIVNASSGSIVD